MSSTVIPTNCPNCGAPLGGAFCASCGQKQAPLNPTFHDVLHDLVHEFTHVDGKIVQSVRRLLINPGFLSREYFAGRRASYVSPLRLYVLLSLVYFAAATLNPVGQVRVHTTFGKTDTEVRRREMEVEAQELQKVANETLLHWAPRAMFLLVPIFAGLVALAARRSERNYPQHLYFSMHVHAAWFAAGAVASLAAAAAVPYLSRAVSASCSLYAVAYFVAAFRRVYDVRLVPALVRTAAVAGTYAIVVAATLLAIVLPKVFPGMLNK